MGRIPERLQERFGRSAHFYPQHSLTAMRIEYDKLQILNDIDPSRAAAFSGYRVEKIVPPGNAAGHAAVRERIVRRTARAVLDLRYRDYHTYLCGMATGFDLWAGLAVLSLKKQLPDLRLIAVVPYRGLPGLPASKLYPVVFPRTQPGDARSCLCAGVLLRRAVRRHGLHGGLSPQAGHDDSESVR